MGYATERIFLPLLKTTAPELVDYKMPENGVFHNLILAKFNALYPAHATQLMHAFWGVGQMSFVKHAVFVPSSAPHLDDYANLTKYILNRFSPQSMLITSGVCDQLDHASPNACFGGKLGIDASVDNSSSAPNLISDDKLLYKFKSVNQNILELKQYFLDTKSPICFVKFDKDRLVKQVFDELKPFDEHFKILIFVDVSSRLENLYMLVWRITNNIDAKRDIFVRNELICIDATSKFELDGYTRGWPKETNCSKEVIENLIKKGLLERDEELFEKFEIFG